MGRRDQQEARDASYPASGVGAFSRESARAGGSPYQVYLRAQELSARQLIPITIAKLREMEARMAVGTPVFCKRMRPSFEEKKKFLARLIAEVNAT